MVGLCNSDHASFLGCGIPVTAGGNDLVPRQKGNAMTDLNNEVREMPVDELSIYELNP